MSHIAQFNIGRMRAPLTDPLMQGFVSQLVTINQLAEEAAGFVWRLQTPAGDATSIRIYDDDWLIVNMSVWESIEALWDFTYKTQHAQVLSHRKEWFERLDAPILVLWWIAEGETITAEDGKTRLEHLRQHGPTPQAFTFKVRFPDPQAVAQTTAHDNES